MHALKQVDACDPPKTEWGCAMLHVRAPEAVKQDPHLYAVWRYEHQSENEAAMFREQALSVAAMLSIFRDEWHRAQAVQALLAQRMESPPGPQETNADENRRP
jgi:hypothetical protein